MSYKSVESFRAGSGWK